ncbi:hypothetical protein ACF3NA_02790 [Alkanindiges sp. WGS2144]|uniref:hypothetical protein n=1 Tax=Alkanindiges sp. WGS2144 TaxID=3366808 RepID=UPI00375013F2
MRMRLIEVTAEYLMKRFYRVLSKMFPAMDGSEDRHINAQSADATIFFEHYLKLWVQVLVSHLHGKVKSDTEINLDQAIAWIVRFISIQYHLKKTKGRQSLFNVPYLLTISKFD